MSLRKEHIMLYYRRCTMALLLKTLAMPLLKGLNKRVTIIPELWVISTALPFMLLRYAYCQRAFQAVGTQPTSPTYYRPCLH